MTGILLGVPLSLALIPVTAPIAEAKDSNIFPLVPMVFGYRGGETLFGALAWPLFGWWHWPNHSMERMEASRFCRSQFDDQWRLASTAHAPR
jgi:hypothetical protein